MGKGRHPNIDMHFFALYASIAAVVALGASATPSGVPTFLMTDAQLENWLATTDANLTYINSPGTDATGNVLPRAPLNTRVVYCDTRANNVCGGHCTVYDGGPTCLNAPNTACLSATNNVAFCDRSGCGHSCNQFASCGTRLDNNFCYTPGTASILVGNA